ncbi:unnamed protein product, partial [Amoebophrya sp. A25]
MNSDFLDFEQPVEPQIAARCKEFRRPLEFRMHRRIDGQRSVLTDPNLLDQMEATELAALEDKEFQKYETRLEMLMLQDLTPSLFDGLWILRAEIQNGERVQMRVNIAHGEWEMPCNMELLAIANEKAANQGTPTKKGGSSPLQLSP